MKNSPFLLDLQQRTGIDFSVYETTALLDSIKRVFSSIPTFQATVLVPVLCIIVVDILFFIVKTPKTFPVILFFLILLTVAIVVGGGIGFYRASMNLLRDVNEAATLSLETTQLIYKDLQKTTEKALTNEVVIPKASEVLRGVVVGLILPALSTYAIEKAGFLAKGVFWVVEKVFLQILLLASKFIEDAIEKLPLQKTDAKVTGLHEKIGESAEKIQTKLKKLEGIVSVLEKTKMQIRTFSSIGQKLIAVPTLTIIYIYGGISGFILLILWVFFV